MKEWYVIAIRAMRQKRVTEKLQALDVESWYPVRTIWRKQRTGPRKRVEQPLLGSYQFVLFDPEVVSVASISLIDGVLGFLGTSRGPQVVDAREFDRMRACEAAGDYDETLQRLEQMLVGQLVTIDDGVFTGHTGPVTAINGDILSTEVWLFGKPQVLKIHIDRVKKPQ